MIKKRETASRSSGASQPRNKKKSKAILALLDEWLQDESGYDEETWPELKLSLDRDRLSKRKLFDE
jgi:hypothetical protein